MSDQSTARRDEQRRERAEQHDLHDLHDLPAPDVSPADGEALKGGTANGKHIKEAKLT